MSCEKICIIAIFILASATVLGTDALAHHVERIIIQGADHSHHYLAGSPTLNWSTGEIKVDLDHPATRLYMDKVLVYEQAFRDSVYLSGAGQRQGSNSFVIYIELTDSQIEKLKSFNPIGKLELSQGAIRNDDGSHNRRVMYTVKTTGSSPSSYDASCTDGTKKITGVSSGNIKQNSVTISWSALNCPGEYVVRYWETANRAGTMKQSVVSASKSTFTATGLSSGTEYAFRVLYNEPDNTISPKPWKGSNTLNVNTLTPPDTTPPTLTLNGQSTISVSAGNSYSDAGATCKDTVDGTIQPTVQGAVKSSIPGTYTLTYSCSDNAGNHATSVSRTVTVSDNTPPTLTLNGKSTVSISAGNSYSDAGATC
ncbi:MAG: DUF5011 domain-containing protein, partial [Cenarchaeum sp. SB0661_bin_35]|nr:DUF5011 domain-containing protein [Cenarchaeum sp. SB0661_bin_35]